MNPLALTPGLLADAEIAYRRERLAADFGRSGRLSDWWRARRRRRSTADDLDLAA
jgi:hypothetical protein